MICVSGFVCVFGVRVSRKISKNIGKKISNSMNKKRIQIVGFLFNLFANKI